MPQLVGSERGDLHGVHDEADRSLVTDNVGDLVNAGAAGDHEIGATNTASVKTSVQGWAWRFLDTLQHNGPTESVQQACRKRGLPATGRPVDDNEGAGTESQVAVRR
jgi:hypothetical protein